VDGARRRGGGWSADAEARRWMEAGSPGWRRRSGLGARVAAARGRWGAHGWMGMDGDGREIFWMGIPCGAHKTPPSAYILHKISKPLNANKKGRREYQRLRLCEVAWLQSFATVASLSRTARHARCLAAVVCVPSGLELAGKRMLDVDVSPAPAIAGNVQELARGIHVHCKKDPCFNLHNC
jgi:hypothetical protein